MSSVFHARMGEYITGSWRPLVVTYVMIALNLFILMRGFRKA